MRRPSYPTPPTADHEDDFHGTRIPDPYRPLEDSDAPAVRAWILAENELTERLLAAVPGRAAIRERLAELWDYPRAGAPWRRGDRWFQLRNTGLQDQDVLWTAPAPDAEGTVLLDPNGLREHGTAALSDVAVSESGELVAFAISEAGSDWRTWTVKRIATGEELPDRIAWSKFSSAAWTADEAGFVYGRYPEPPAGAAYDAPNRDMELRYHRLGTDPADDVLVLSTPHEPDWGFEPEVTDEGRLLVISVWRGTDPENRIYVADLGDGVEAAKPRPLLDAADAHYELIDAIQGTLYLRTDLEAPLGRVIAVDVHDPGRVREVIPEADDALEHVLLVGDRLAAAYLHDAHHRLVLFGLDGSRVADVSLPGIGTIDDMAGRRRDEDVYLRFTTFARPGSLLAVRVRDGAVREVVRRATLPWDPDAYLTEQVFVAGDDGTRVPLFLTRRRDVVANGDVPTLLYGYGGFRIPIGPMFKPEWLAWMERGGLLAVASLRGGGEYGTAWHDDGRLANKQHVFDDFAACARWLAGSGWTRPGRIGILGRSNGGLLVGASVTQHPELFGAAIAEVGVMDMLRFHRFTIGWGWTSDYGSPDDPEQFRWLLAYSPLHNIRPGTRYPPTLVTTGDHDDRVVPGHSFKFAAALQAAQGGDAPILVRIDTDAGHGVGKPVSKLIDERTDVLAFLELALAGAAATSRAQGPQATREDPVTVTPPDVFLRDTANLLMRTPALLRALLVGLPDAWTGTPDTEGGWRPRDVVGHLISAELDDWIPRARRVLEEGTARPFDPFDRFAHESRDAGVPLDALVERFARLRAESLVALEAEIGPADLDRRGLHPSLGEVTLRHLLATWAVHDLDHLAQLQAGLAGAYDAEVGPWKAYLGILLRREDPAAEPG